MPGIGKTLVSQIFENISKNTLLVSFENDSESDLKDKVQ